MVKTDLKSSQDTIGGNLSFYIKKGYCCEHFHRLYKEHLHT